MAMSETLGLNSTMQTNFRQQEFQGLQDEYDSYSTKFKEIGKVKEQIAMLPKPANTKPIYDALTKLEEYAWELEEDIEELSKDVAVVKKENELQNILIEEVKTLNSNPLGG